MRRLHPISLLPLLAAALVTTATAAPVPEDLLATLVFQAHEAGDPALEQALDAARQGDFLEKVYAAATAAAADGVAAPPLPRPFLAEVHLLASEAGAPEVPDAARRLQEAGLLLALYEHAAAATPPPEPARHPGYEGVRKAVKTRAMKGYWSQAARPDCTEEFLHDWTLTYGAHRTTVFGNYRLQVVVHGTYEGNCSISEGIDKPSGRRRQERYSSTREVSVKVSRHELEVLGLVPAEG